MTDALNGVAGSWYTTPFGLDQFGTDSFIPGTEFLRPILAEDWPTCPSARYDPKTTSWSQIMVNGVPCSIVSPSPRPFA